MEEVLKVTCQLLHEIRQTVTTGRPSPVMIVQDKDIQDQKIGKSVERYTIIGINTSVESQNRIENINNTKNFFPTLYRGNKNNQPPNPNLIKSNKIVNFQNQADNIICQIDNSFLKYIKGDNVIKLIEQDYLNLRKIIRMINDPNSEYKAEFGS